MLLESKKGTGKQNLTVVCAAVISCRVIISIQNESWRREHTLKRMQYHLFLERLMEHWKQAVQNEMHLLTSVFHPASYKEFQ